MITTRTSTMSVEGMRLPDPCLSPIDSVAQTVVTDAADVNDSTEYVPSRDYLDLSIEDKEKLFRRVWAGAVSDNRLDLFGFRRYRTAQLLNLRFLEEEMLQLHSEIIRAGLQHGEMPIIDRLGLKHKERVRPVMNIADVVSHGFVEHLRKVTKVYNDALLSFNNVMAMETFCLADNVSKSNPVTKENAKVSFKVRLLRADLPLRQMSRDPVQHFLRKCLRRIWYLWLLSRSPATDVEQANGSSKAYFNAYIERIWGNTSRIAEIFSRFIIGMTAGAALVTPLNLLSNQPTPEGRMLVVIVSIIIFCLVVSTLSKATHYESMAASAAYAAVLTVFLSNTPN